MKKYLKAIALAAMAFVSANLLSACHDTDDSPAQITNSTPNLNSQVVSGQPVVQQQQNIPQVTGQSVQQPTVVYEQAPQQQPVIIQQQAPQYDSTGHLLTTMATMHMMGHVFGGGNRTVVHHYETRRVYVAPRSYGRSYGSSRGYRTGFRRR